MVSMEYIWVSNSGWHWEYDTVVVGGGGGVRCTLIANRT